MTRPSGRHRVDRDARQAAHLEGLAPDPDLRPGEFVSDGRVYRIRRLPNGFEILVQVRMLPWKRAQLFDPIANARAAARYMQQRYGPTMPQHQNDDRSPAHAKGTCAACDELREGLPWGTLTRPLPVPWYVRLWRRLRR